MGDRLMGKGNLFSTEQIFTGCVKPECHWVGPKSLLTLRGGQLNRMSNSSLRFNRKVYIIRDRSTVTEE